MLLDDIISYFQPFESICDNDKNELLFLSYSQNIEKGELVLDSDTFLCENIIIVKSGRLRVYFEKEKGKTITLYNLNEGEICVLAASRYLYQFSVSIKILADRPSCIIKIPVSFYMELERRYPVVERYSRKLFIDRFSDILYTLKQKAFKNDESFLKEYILEEAAQNKDGIIEKSQDEIRKETAISSGQISEILKKLENLGAIRMGRNKIQVVNLKKLV